MPDAGPSSARARRAALAAAALLLALTAATSVTRVFRDSPTGDGPMGGTYELEADNYVSLPRQRIHGVPLERTHAVYLVHAPLQSLLTLGMAALDPGHVHRAVRQGTLLLHLLLVTGATVLAFRRWAGTGATWPWAVLACWALAPGLWGLARLAYSEHYVGLALALALVATPAPVASVRRVALGGAGAGVLLASKFYGVLPVAVVALGLLREDVVLRRVPWRPVAWGLAACAAAAVLWGAAGAAYGIDPWAALLDHWASVGEHRERMGMGPADVVLGLPRALGAWLPGRGWEWIVALLCLRQAAAAGWVDRRRFLVWTTCALVPYVLSPWSYRLWPLLVAFPFLAARPAPAPAAPRAWPWPLVVIETLVLANVLRRLHPDLLENRSRTLALACLAAVLGVRALAGLGRRSLARSDRGRGLVERWERWAPRALAAACAVVALAGAAWHLGNWARPTWGYDESARRVAARAPDDASVAGIIPELWCRYLPRARCRPTEVALRSLPADTALRSDVVVLPDPAFGGAWYERYFEGCVRYPEPIPYWNGREGRIVVGIRRPR